MFEEWKSKDPIERFERYLLSQGLATEDELRRIVATIDEELNREVDAALASPFPPPERAFEGVYA